MTGPVAGEGRAVTEPQDGPPPTKGTEALCDARPNKDTLGRLFIDRNGVVWEQISYTDKPTVSFRRSVEPSQRLSCVVGSRLYDELEPLSERDEQMFRARLDRE